MHDVDDCWALVHALQAEELIIHGVSTVFGNSSESDSYYLMTALLDQILGADLAPTIYRGASRPLAEGVNSGRGAVEALSSALKKRPLTIIALGPLTNIAALITEYPELIQRIDELVVVAGQRPEQGSRFHPGTSRVFHVHDFNFRNDVSAFQLLLDTDLSMTFMPYEVASKVGISEEDLEAMKLLGSRAELLALLAEPWLNYWKTTFGSNSFYPFDSLAVSYVIDATHFSCEYLPVQIDRRPSLFLNSRDRLLVSEDFETDTEVNYCYDVDTQFKHDLLLNLKR